VAAPLLALGFRPFYLLAGLYAALSVPLMALQFADVLPGVDPLWHAHEMLFGYAFAVIAGFLFTAVRNWTSRPTPAGAQLAAIALVWILARVLAYGWPGAAALCDALFAAAVAWGIGRPIVASRNRNWFFILLVLALGAASSGFHAAPQLALSAGLDLVLFIVALMAGRVVPGFTNNAVPGAGARRIKSLEVAALGSILLLLALALIAARWCEWADQIICSSSLRESASRSGKRLGMRSRYRSSQMRSHGWWKCHPILRRRL